MPLTSYNSTIGQKPSVLDAILLQGVSSTPLLQWLGRGEKISAPKHSWILDKYDAPKENANVEVSDLEENTKNTKYMKDNVVQIIKTEFGISYEEDDNAKYGEKEWPYLVGKKGKEHAKDIEYALLGLHNDNVTDGYTEGSDTTPAKMAGLFHYIDNTKDYKDSDGNPTQLTYDRLNELIEMIWQYTDIEDPSFMLICGSGIKRTINGFAKDYFRWFQSDNGKFDPTLYVVTTDFGDIKVKIHRLFNDDKLKDKILIGKLNEADIRFKIPTRFEEPPTSKTAKFGRYYTSLTLEVKRPDYFAFGSGLK